MASMQGGKGKSSYVRNSGLQSELLNAVWPDIVEAVEGASFHGTTIHIADFGCSSGFNTINLMNSLVDVIKSKLQQSATVPEFQAHFSDLPSNDYNTLFSLFPEHNPYLYSAVPGSFYGKLLPRSSIHFAACCMALHWLSEVPKSVKNKESDAWNPGTVWVEKGSGAAYSAFQEQGHKDLCSFLNARSVELLEGGLLCLLILGKEEKQARPWYQSFQKAWETMVKQGSIKQEALDSYNVQVFFRDPEHIVKAVEETGCFDVVCLKEVDIGVAQLFSSLDHKTYASRVTNSFKALVGKSVQEHLGDPALAEELFHNMEINCPSREEVPLHAPITLVIVKRRTLSAH